MYWINLISLSWLFLFLLAFHVILFYSLGTHYWLAAAIVASVINTVIVAALQRLLTQVGREKEK
jgi:predicted MFS family arabinose efflux permease